LLVTVTYRDELRNEHSQVTKFGPSNGVITAGLHAAPPNDEVSY
jgi:hypothetical protein